MLPNRMVIAHALLLMTLSAFVSTTSASSLSITVLNRSFETPPVPMDGNPATRSNGDDFVVATPDDWMAPVDPSAAQGSLTRSAGSFYENKLTATPDPSDNDQTYWSNGGAIYQVLSASLLPNSIYTLTADIGDRTGTNFPADTELRLGFGETYGATLLTPESVANPAPPDGSWATWENVYMTGPSPDGLGQPLRIELVSGGSQAIFDNVQVAVAEVPEPATWALGGIALLTLCCARPRVRRRFLAVDRQDTST